MSEDEIIKEVENYENWKVVYNPGGLYQFIPLPKDYKQAIQGLLDLYQKEKEKNEELMLKITDQIIRKVEIEVFEDMRKELEQEKEKNKELDEENTRQHELLGNIHQNYRDKITKIQEQTLILIQMK